ncbi:hypothetical protein AWC27_19580 [Mycobacterium szulgai]|uniref:Uncharacterized protein n=1 Tax=Mycobacterium szulgai TaxID=1787 RepID=A0A1X2FA37_MYCSZ|nr:hypothetical protein [Mycobacterium szulgai]ETZ96750.1 hypothetical protein I547_7592 [Mycobacterium kansasii 824]ORX15322.1 hypothetical protein AWC27_19580 [Mycobacterium szulgai]
MSDLTTDQRWLLYFMGGWQIRDCLIDTAGTDHLMQSMWGSCGFTGPEGGPEWMTGWETRNGKVHAPGRGESRVVITKAQINAYARSLRESVRADLVALRAEARAEVNRTAGWCHCPWSQTAPNAHSGPCQRYHPIDDEDDAHYATVRRIDYALDEVLWRALDLHREPIGQLELFAAL